MSLSRDFSPFREPAFVIVLALLLVGMAAISSVIYYGTS